MHCFSESSIKNDSNDMYNMAIFKKSYTLTIFRVLKKWPNVWVNIKKVTQGLEAGKNSFQVSGNCVFRNFKTNPGVFHVRVLQMSTGPNLIIFWNNL